jgi:hypothetical protein
MATMTQPTRTIINDDYAVLWTGKDKFYYGYEFGKDEDDSVWGFIYKHENMEQWRISYADMNTRKHCPDQFDCAECLLFGIGLWREVSEA